MIFMPHLPFSTNLSVFLSAAMDMLSDVSSLVHPFLLITGHIHPQLSLYFYLCTINQDASRQYILYVSSFILKLVYLLCSGVCGI